jgi:anti-sigma28 factor (negative regulator of flagellin synthesis)
MKHSLLTRYRDKLSRTKSLHTADTVKEERGLSGSDDQAQVLHGRNPMRHVDAGTTESPESRAERVAELRRQVSGGTYEIPISQLVRILTSVVLRRR